MVYIYILDKINNIQITNTSTTYNVGDGIRLYGIK